MSQDHHAYLKWPRLIAFNLNGALAITATGLSARSLVNLNHDRGTLASQIPGAVIHATDVVAASAIMTTATGVASLYTAALSTAVTLKWHREETKKSIMVKEICMLIMALFILGAAIAATVIIVPRSAGVSAPGLPSSIIAQLIAASGKSLAYRDSIVFPALIVVWLCFGTTLLSFVLAALASRHIAKYGPENTLIGHKVSDNYANGHGDMHEKNKGTAEHI